jgi:hypothetical protein
MLYVCHVADNLRIWAERLAGLALGASGPVANHDGDLLARARSYKGVPIQASLWSLQRASGDWMEAFRLAVDKGVVLLHPDRGEQSTVDVARSNAHDVHRHESERPRARPDYDVTPAWVLHHLLQHEAEHSAQIAAIRDRLRATT